MSYLYVRQKSNDYFSVLTEMSDNIMVDSGAHTFQHGKSLNDDIDWYQYTREYVQWIKENDNDKVVGYFEMDIDNVIPYEQVKELRAMLYEATDKIIPVWHKTLGIDEFKNMVAETRSGIVAITGFGTKKSELDIRRDQYNLFVNYAHEHGVKIHGLGLTRDNVLKKVHFDYVDSSSWKNSGVFGGVAKFDGNKIVTKGLKGKKAIQTNYKEIWRNNMREWRKYLRFMRYYWNVKERKN